MKAQNVYLIILTELPPGKRKRCYLLRGRECRIPAKEAEKFLPMMEKMHDQKLSNPFAAIESFYGPKIMETEKVYGLFLETVKRKNKNKLKWLVAIHFPKRPKKSN